MGVLTDFFLATNSDLKRVLSGWQLPPPLLPEPVVVQTINPFTRQPAQITTRRDRNKLPVPDPRAVPSPDISSLPNVPCKGFLPDKLALAFLALTDITVDDAMDSILCGDLIGPPDTEIMVLLLPTDFTVALASASPGDLARAAHSIVDGDDMESPDASSAYAEILREVQSLAVRGQAEEAGLFVWICP